jgi:arylsulfatase
MEVYAGFAEHTDYEIGRLVKALEDIGEMDNTLFIYIVGDNGASAEGGLGGTFNELMHLNGLDDSIEEGLKHIDDLGGPMAYGHYHAAWAVAGNTPFQWSKQVASHYGGTRDPMVVHWTKGIKARGELRSQWHHVVDIAPTIMEAAGLPFPKTVNGAVQKPFEGVSLAYSFDDAKAEDRHTTQYFEMFGNRAVYHNGWVAAAKHRSPWNPVPDQPLDQDKWELYHVAEDFNQFNDVAAANPEELKELQDLFIQEAVKYNVLPLDDRAVERFDARLAGRPDLMAGRTSLTVYEGMTGMSENAFINVKNRSHTITAEVDIPTGGADGVILAHGGRFLGWSLYMKDGRVSYVYNWVGKERYTLTSEKEVPAGKAVIRFEFAYDGGRPGSGGTGTIYVNGEKAAEGRIDKTNPFISASGTTDVGIDEDTPVTEAYKQRHNRFTGKINKVVISLK